MKPKILAIIPARGGSKGVPRKNIRNLAGKPLIAWTIDEAKKSRYIDRVILSSEDEEIIEVAKKYGCDVPFIRPLELAQDDTPGIVPVLHAIEQCPGYDYVILLQPTSPLRTVADIDGCIEYLFKKQAKICVSVTDVDKSPYWMFVIDNGQMKPLIRQDELITRRQDSPSVYALNGAIYVAKIDVLLETNNFLTDYTLAYKMDKENSYDIDTITDFEICEMIKLKSELKDY